MRLSSYGINYISYIILGKESVVLVILVGQLRSVSASHLGINLHIPKTAFIILFNLILKINLSSADTFGDVVPWLLFSRECVGERGR